MDIKHVKGKKTRDILVYTLTTCGWCRKTKQYLNDKGVSYSYVDVDLLDDDENARAMEEVRRWNPSGSFPTIVVDNKSCIKGFNTGEINEAIRE